MQGHMRTIAESAAVVALKDPSILSDEDLEAELERRRKVRKEAKAAKTAVYEKRAEEIAAALNAKRDEKLKALKAKSVENPWLPHWDAELVKAVAREGTESCFEDVVEYFKTADPDDLATILDAFCSNDDFSNGFNEVAMRFGSKMRRAGDAFESGADDNNGNFGFTRWEKFDGAMGVQALEIHPAAVDAWELTGDESDEGKAWSPITLFQFRGVIEQLFEIFDELEDFGYVTVRIPGDGD